MIVAAVLLGMAACKTEPSYKITVNITNMPDGLKVYLENSNERGVKLDSAVTKNGNFVFTGKTIEPFVGDVVINTPGEQFAARSFDVFIENSDIRIDANWDDLFNMTIVGSTLEDEKRAYEKQIRPIREKMNVLHAEEWNVYSDALYSGKFTADCIKPGIEVAKKRRNLERELHKMDMEYIKTHPASPVSLGIYERMLRNNTGFTLAEMQEIDRMLSSELKQTKGYAKIGKMLADYAKLAKGAPFIDFKVVDVNGKEGMFSDYVNPGQYNLLEVWASWCGHCRVEIPHLKIVQGQYGNRFNIIAVSWDKDEAEWRKAMEEDKPGYIQLRAIPDEKGVDVGKCYGLRGIPYSLVIDGSGDMMTDEARGTALDLLLEELCGK